MCAIWGYVSSAGSKSRPSIDALEAIVDANECRGMHAFGLAWVERDGRLRHYKQPGRLSKHAWMLHALRDARIILGHLRWATHGEPADNINNHPHACDGGMLVHNGVVLNDYDLYQRNNLWKTCDCDSETLARMIERQRGADMLERVCRVSEKQIGHSVIAGVWTRPARLIIARAGNPMNLGMLDDGGIYFATLPKGLPGTIHSMEANTGMEIIFRGRPLSQRIRFRKIKPLPIPKPMLSDSDLLEADAEGLSDAEEKWIRDLDDNKLPDVARTGQYRGG